MASPFLHPILYHFDNNGKKIRTISRFITRKGTHNFDLLVVFMPSFDLWLKKANSDSLVNLFDRSGSCLSAVLVTEDFLPEAWFLLLEVI